MAEHRVEAIRVVLHCRREGQARKLGQAGVANRRSKTQVAQFFEAYLGRHALVLFEGIIPHLGRTDQMI
jgi:hypothetical protein